MNMYRKPSMFVHCTNILGFLPMGFLHGFVLNAVLRLIESDYPIVTLIVLFQVGDLKETILKNKFKAANVNVNVQSFLSFAIYYRYK